ncbi:AsmA-like C-terminal region-containing protein [Alkalimarinus alittae]|uniref:AsmA-like C-terminal region-containing protein n=1 Tax=Alkalimarinus alittae TaxID=2961619 RepID=A0ABY6N1J0_9ALTE|nr:AsmA-like C-terminal region-containing protein [Alkalimarinus alittae]UZE95895.1 AsmA-like C-terminal region-containing protein [Alkalimarinus alittae]
MDKRLSSRISNLVLIVFLVVIVLLSVIKLIFPAENYRQQITAQLTNITGQPIEISGALEWYLSPFPSLYADSIIARNSDFRLDEVSVSFSMLDLARFKVTPTELRVEKAYSLFNVKAEPLFEQATIRFNPAGTLPNSFELITRHNSLLRGEGLNVRGHIEHLDAGRFHIEGTLINMSEARQGEKEPFENTSLNVDLAQGENPNAHTFDLRLSAGDLIVSSSGQLTTSKQQVSVEFAQIKTPNMTLSGQSTWLRESSSIHNTFQGKRIAIPDICFEKPYRSNSVYCYDLAMLMMLPGQNALQANTLDVHQQTLKDLNLSWQISDGEIIINHATAQAMGGTLNLNGGFVLASSSWNFSLQSQQIQIETLLSAFDLKPQLFGTGSINLTGSGELKDNSLENHKISGEVVITNGKTALFNLEKELCTQVKGVVITDSTTTPFQRLTVSIEKENNHLKIPYFISQLDGATISGQGKVTQDNSVSLNMNIKLDKQEWSLCKLPRALTGVDWPLTCKKQLSGAGNCNINFKQMGLSALLLAEDPERKDKAKQQFKELKESKKVKKVLNRLEKWLEE